MYENPVLINFLVAPSLLKKIEKIRSRRMVMHAGHVSRSALLRELINEKVSEMLEEGTAQNRAA